MKKFIVLLFVIFCIGLMYQFPHAMLNPGELTEGHQKLRDDCFSCHDPFWGISNNKCISCHELSDIGKDKLMSNGTSKSVSFHEHLSNLKCTSCHTDHIGLKPEKSLANFEHSMLPENLTNDCSSCHGQPQDNLHKQLTTECNNCHNTNGWKSNVTFKHEMIQSNLRNNCISCHNSPQDSFHKMVNNDCYKCHNTTKWKPSTFDHSAFFILDKDHNTDCKTCHTKSITEYTCYGCHEHSESKIKKEHFEKGIVDFANCVSCHRSGDEHDIRMNENSNRKLNQDELKIEKKNNKSREQENKKEYKIERDHDDD